MRGQAHITYKDIPTAAQAMRQLDGFDFFGRPMVLSALLGFLVVLTHAQKISFAKSKSNFVAKLDGTFKIPDMTDGTKTTDGAPVIGDKGTALQQAVFGGAPAAVADSGTKGVKRGRDEEEGSDVPMEEDEQDMEMDESDED
jgi:U2 small nuclear ribonucleoprotein B''